MLDFKLFIDYSEYTRYLENIQSMPYNSDNNAMEIEDWFKKNWFKFKFIFFYLYIIYHLI